MAITDETPHIEIDEHGRRAYLPHRGPNRADGRRWKREVRQKPNAAPPQIEEFTGFKGAGPSEKAVERLRRMRLLARP